MKKVVYSRKILLVLVMLFWVGWIDSGGTCQVAAETIQQTDEDSGEETKEDADQDTRKASENQPGKTSKKSQSKKGSLPVGRHLFLEQGEEDLFLVNEDGKKQSGWYLWSGKTYWKLGKIKDIGLYRRKKFHLIYADAQGRIPQDSEVCGVPFDAEGSAAGAQGIYRIRGKYYLIFQGRLQTTDITQKKVTYYMNLDGTLAYYRRRGKCFDPSGKPMDARMRSEAQTRQQARKVLRVILRKSMTRKQKLEACFQWVVDHYGYDEKRCRGNKGWTSESGYQLLRYGNGDCRVLSAGLAFLASELGFRDVYICQDSRNRFSGSHCWTEINGKCFDPLFYNSPRPRRRMRVFCGSTPEQYHSKTHCVANQKFKPGD